MASTSFHLPPSMNHQQQAGTCGLAHPQKPVRQSACSRRPSRASLPPVAFCPLPFAFGFASSPRPMPLLSINPPAHAAIPLRLKGRATSPRAPRNAVAEPVHRGAVETLRPAAFRGNPNVQRPTLNAQHSTSARSNVERRTPSLERFPVRPFNAHSSFSGKSL